MTEVKTSQAKARTRKAAYFLGWRSFKLAVIALSKRDYRVCKIRLQQIKVCFRQWKKALPI